jgi:hypothetical protein
MTRPIGAQPQAAVLLDDTYFDLQCSVDAQCLNTNELLSFMDAAEQDGFIDADEWRYIRRHVRLEATFNTEAESLVRWGRVQLNKLLGLVTNLRARVQEKKKAALQSGPPSQVDKIIAG